MAETISFNNTIIAGLDAEKYFAVNLELIGCKIYTTDIWHMILTAGCIIFYR